MMKYNNSFSGYYSLRDDYTLKSENLRNNQNYVIGKKNKTSIILRYLYMNKKLFFPFNILESILFVIIKKIIIERFNITNKRGGIIGINLIITLFFILLVPIFVLISNIIGNYAHLLYLLLYINYIIFYNSLFNNYFKMGVYVIRFRRNKLESFFDNYEENIVTRIVFKSNDKNN